MHLRPKEGVEEPPSMAVRRRTDRPDESEEEKWLDLRFKVERLLWCWALLSFHHLEVVRIALEDAHQALHDVVIHGRGELLHPPAKERQRRTQVHVSKLAELLLRPGGDERWQSRQPAHQQRINAE